MIVLEHKLVGGFMTGTNQIYARQRFYANPRSNSVHDHHVRKEKKIDPNLGVRLDKILKENLNISTQSFVTSLKEWHDKNGFLTAGQLSSFEKVESRYSPGEKEKLKSWTEEYKTNHLEDAKLLARYYLNEGYWTDMASNIINGEEYIPPRHKYMKMSTNKYAQNVMSNARDLPKFEKSSMVQLRSTFGRDSAYCRLREFANRLCFVISTEADTLSAVKDGKGYTILPMGHSSPISVEQRHIMKPNKKGTSC